uniref:Uncharacterized protein n=2 Tax=Parascaris TaxID=6254 RepID=A0A915APN9_PARUN
MDIGSLLVYALTLCTLCSGRENLRAERDADPNAVYLSGFSTYHGLQRSLNALPPNGIFADNMLNEDLAGALPVPQGAPQLAPFTSRVIPNYSSYPVQIAGSPDWNRLIEESLAKTFDVNSPAMTKIIEKIEVAVKHAASMTTSTVASSVTIAEDTPASTQAAPTSTTSIDVEKDFEKRLLNLLDVNASEKDDGSESIDLPELQPKLMKKAVNSKGIGAAISLDGSDNDTERELRAKILQLLNCSKLSDVGIAESSTVADEETTESSTMSIMTSPYIEELLTEPSATSTLSPKGNCNTLNDVFSPVSNPPLIRCILNGMVS